MSDAATSDTRDLGDEPGKTRTWRHPLLARLLAHVLVTEDVAGGLGDEELARLRDLLERRRGK